MLAGHWADRVLAPPTGLPPPNIDGYVRAGLLPNFSKAIGTGVFVKCWNRGQCITPLAMKYLASGSYDVEAAPTGSEPYWAFSKGGDLPTISSACKNTYPNRKVASFGSDAWMQSGWWKAPDCTMGSFQSYYSDFLTMQQCLAWLCANPDWSLVLLYLSQYDKTGNCPLLKKDAAYTEDKHHSIQRVDHYLGDVMLFLEESGLWDETILVVASDHGCHYGCDVTVREAREHGIPENVLPNYCGSHQAPWDCLVWDFERARVTEQRSDCARRTTFILTGGALSAEQKAGARPEAEIVDVPATIADVLAINLDCEGRSIFK